MRRGLAVLLQLVGALTLLASVIGGGLALSAGLWLPMDDQPRQSAALVVMAGDIRRSLHAADLYHQGFAPVVYVARPRHEPSRELAELGWEFPTQEDESRLVLTRRGVPEEAVRVYGHDLLSTVEEVENLRAALRSDGVGPGPLLVVTSPYHCRRTAIILSRLIRDREILTSASPYERFEAKWWTHQESASVVIRELAKFAFYYLGTPFRSQTQGAQ